MKSVDIARWSHAGQVSNAYNAWCPHAGKDGKPSLQHIVPHAGKVSNMYNTWCPHAGKVINEYNTSGALMQAR